jgi:BolA protein
MDIIDLIAIVKKKIKAKVLIEDIEVEDKSFLHKNHSGNQPDKFHLKIKIKSNELKKMGRINSNKRIYSILNEEMKHSIHSLQILIC